MANFEYTQAYLSPFSWAKTAYNYYLGLSSDQTTVVTPTSLTAPIFSSIDNSPINIATSSDWNTNTTDQITNLAGMYTSIDQGSSYFNSLYTQINARLQESESRVKNLQSSLNVLQANSNLIASTSVDIQGGDLSSIETNSVFYKNIEKLQAVPSEGIFRLKDTGAFSSIRSLGGFPGNVVIENSLGQIYEQGVLSNIVDGSRNTFWMSTYYAPSLVRSDVNNVSWLPNQYTDGFALQITYYLDRPTLATEVFINPITTEPFDLVSVSWTPSTIQSCINTLTFPGTGWSFNNSFIDPNNGVGGGPCSSTYGPSGTVYCTFLIPASSLTLSSSSLVGQGSRAELTYSMKGLGDCVSGARMSWLDNSGTVIDYKLQENFCSGFYNTYRLVDYIPNNAVSGKLEFGIITTSTNLATAFIDNPYLLIGEQTCTFNASISDSTTLPLPQIVKSQRFTFVLTQRNPRREVISKESSDTSFTPISGSTDIDISLQNATQQLASSLTYPGPEISSFAYRLGMKELDLRYREHKPRGSLVTLPLSTSQEIRWIWATVQADLNNNNGTTFQIYPFQNDPNTFINIQPYILGDVTNNSGLSQNGQILRIYTYEEVLSGYFNPQDTYYITNYNSQTDNFDGTDRNGLVTLSSPLHLRLPLQRDINNWLQQYSIWPTTFDPNLATIYGIPNTVDGIQLKNEIRNESVSGDVSLDQFISREGYMPVQVTIITDKWTAYPDIYGRPDTSRIRTIVGETLQRTTVTQSNTQSRIAYLTFDTWIATTTSRTLKANATLIGNNINNGLYNTLIQAQNIDLPLKQALDNLKTPYTALTNTYNLLYNQGLIPEDANQTTILQSEIEVNDTFATQFSPIIGSSAGNLLQLFWANTASGMFIPVAQSDYELIDNNTGLIQILGVPPGAEYTEIVADYNYVSYSQTEDHSSDVIGLINTFSTTSSGASSELNLLTKPFPLTRNLTDYVNGIVPTLTLPNFNRLDAAYYPIIEYYINSQNQIQFARDFFKYGSIPGIVIVKYDTLNISPRLGTTIIRTGSPSTSPSISSMSLRVKENATSLLMSSQ